MGGGTHYDLCRCARASGTPGMGYLISQKMGETEFAPCGKHSYSWVSMMA